MRDRWTRGFVLLIFALGAVGGFVLGVQRGSAIGYAAGTLSLAIGLGLWFEHAWARYAATALFLLGAVTRGVRAAREGGTSRWFSAIAALYGAQMVWSEWRPRRVSRAGIRVLLRRARQFSRAELAEAARRAWSLAAPAVHVDALVPPGGAEGEAPRAFSLAAPPGPVSLIVSDGPFLAAADRATGAEATKELRLRHAIESHAAWFMVDSPLPLDTKESAAMECCIGQLVAALLDADSIALHSEALGFALVGPGTAAALALHPAAAFRLMPAPPVVSPDDDTAMATAVAQARASLPEFEAGFRARREGAEFYVKAPFSEGGYVEHLWIRVTGIAAESMTGTVDNSPVQLRRPQLGQVVRVARSEISDWIVRNESGQLGGFTLSVLLDKRA